MTRTTKTPRARAEETRDRAKRRDEKAAARLAKAVTEYREASEEKAQAEDALKYAELNPALRSDVTAQTGAGAVTTTVGGATT